MTVWKMDYKNYSRQMTWFFHIDSNTTGGYTADWLKQYHNQVFISVDNSDATNLSGRMATQWTD